MSALYTVRARDDLGAMPAELARQHLTLAETEAWLDEHYDVGTFEIIDERDGLMACGIPLELAGGAVECECPRCVRSAEVTS